MRDIRDMVDYESSQNAIEEIYRERCRQVDSEGWTSEHDDEHTDGSLAMAAAYYAVSDKTREVGRCPYHALLWPWRSYPPKLKDRRRDLIRAGALIVAEIERLDRATANRQTIPTTSRGAR